MSTAFLSKEVEEVAVLIKTCFHLIRYEIHSMILAAEKPSWKLKTFIRRTKKNMGNVIMPNKGRQEFSRNHLSEIWVTVGLNVF